MLNKLFWRNKKETPKLQKSNSLLSGLSEKVKQSRLAFGVLIGGILSGCAWQQNTQEFDTQKINADKQYSQASEKKAAISDITSALAETQNHIEVQQNQETDNLEIIVKKQEQDIQVEKNIEVQQDQNQNIQVKNNVETQKYDSYHIVKSWERIYSIARKYGLNPYKVMKLNENRFQDLDTLHVGDKILLGDILQGGNISTQIIAEQKPEEISEIPTTQVEEKIQENIKKIDIQNLDFSTNPILSTATKIVKDDTFDITSLIENKETNGVKKPKTYEINQWESLDIVAKKLNIDLGKLIQYNSFLAIRNKKPILYPTYKIFLEQPDLHSLYVQNIIEKYNKYHAAIDYDRKMRAEYKAEIIARRQPGYQDNQKPKIVEKQKEAQELPDNMHRVVYWDTLSEIAVKYSTTQYKLQQLNNIENPSELSIGQVIKIPDMNKDLLSYKQKLKLSEEEKKNQFYRDIKKALEYNPTALERLIWFLQENISDVSSQEMLKNVNSKIYLIGLLYSLEDHKLRDNFANSIKHPQTTSQEIIPTLKNRTKYSKCGQAVRAGLQALFPDLSLPDYWMHANLIPGILENHKDFIAVAFNDISELKPGAILTYQPGFWTSKDRKTYGHAEIFVWTNISKNDNNTWVKYYATHVYSSKYGHFYPYLWGSVNQAKKEAGLNAIAYYPASLFDPEYKNMSDAEYAKSLKEKEKPNQMLASTSENTPVAQICEVKQQVEILTQWEINKRTNKYITQYLKTDMNESNTKYILRKLSTSQTSAKQCLESIAKHYMKIAKMEQNLYKNDANSQARLNTYLPKIQATTKLLRESKQMEIATTNVAPNPK